MERIGLIDCLNNPSLIRTKETIIPPSGGGNYIPLSVVTRDMGAGSFSPGGALVSSGVNPEVASALRDNSIVGKAGGVMKFDLQLPTAFPVFNSEPQATFVGEFGAAVSSDYAVAIAQMSPHAVRTTFTLSNLLLAQSTPKAEEEVSKNATASIMSAVDKAVLVGTGGVQPLGLVNTVGVNKITLGGPVTLTQLLAFESAVGLAKAEGPNASLGWALSPATRAALKGRQKFAAGSDTLMSDFNRILGYSTGVSTSLTGTNQLIYANWSQVIVGFYFGGIFALSDKFTLAKTNETIITLTAFVDAGILHPSAACYSTDSAL